MSAIPQLLEANERYATDFDLGDLPSPPARRVAILTCMDSRMDPAKILGLEEGDAHVIRNAGGRASDDALRSLIVSYKLLGVREIVVIHHTDCGMQGLDTAGLVDALERDPGGDASEVDFLPFDDLEQSVFDDVMAIHNSPLTPYHLPVTGYIYDVKTGRLRHVI